MSLKLLFISGTRADFGKIKGLMEVLPELDVDFRVFVTGMHMLPMYGETWREFQKQGFPFHNYVSFSESETNYSAIFAKTVAGISDYLSVFRPDAIVVHGDRLEALAGAIVGVLSNIRVLHIEGGEVSGTVDESMRHAISKLAHGHLVSNEQARHRLLQMGEEDTRVAIIGSPELDAFSKDHLPTLDEVKQHYEIPFNSYALLVMHPVVTDPRDFGEVVNDILSELLKRQINTVAISPNNDQGSDRIRAAYTQLQDCGGFILIPSVRFESYITLLRHAQFIVGNSSSGVREAHFLGTPAVDVGDRQNGRVSSEMVIDASYKAESIGRAIDLALATSRTPQNIFGDGQSASKFRELLKTSFLDKLSLQKRFEDRRH